MRSSALAGESAETALPTRKTTGSTRMTRLFLDRPTVRMTNVTTDRHTIEDLIASMDASLKRCSEDVQAITPTRPRRREVAGLRPIQAALTSGTSQETAQASLSSHDDGATPQAGTILPQTDQAGLRQGESNGDRSRAGLGRTPACASRPYENGCRTFQIHPQCAPW